MGSGPNGCFTPRTYQHVNLGVAGIVLYPIALLWSFVGTQYTPRYVPAAAPPLPLNV